MEALVRGLRLAFRLGALGCVTASVFTLWLVGAPLAVLFGRRSVWRDRCTCWWARALLPCLGIRVASSGPVPSSGRLLVSNHLSYVDVLVLASQRPLTFVAKSEVAGWPVLGWVAWAVGVVFVDRTDKRKLPATAARLRGELEAGSVVVVFPEGTSSPGDEVLAFKPSLLAAAVEAARPVAYAALAYSTPDAVRPARESVCWWGDMTFLDHFLGLLALPHVDARVAFGGDEIGASADEGRKALAAALQERVTALHAGFAVRSA